MLSLAFSLGVQRACCVLFLTFLHSGKAGDGFVSQSRFRSRWSAMMASSTLPALLLHIRQSQVPGLTAALLEQSSGPVQASWHPLKQTQIAREVTQMSAQTQPMSHRQQQQSFPNHCSFVWNFFKKDFQVLQTRRLNVCGFMGKTPLSYYMNLLSPASADLNRSHNKKRKEMWGESSLYSNSIFCCLFKNGHEIQKQKKWLGYKLMGIT